VNEHVEAAQCTIPGTLPPLGPMHPLPQDPQLFGSVVVSTHEPQHAVSPASHSMLLQTPHMHLSPLVQEWPHVPQLNGSVWVSASHPVDVSPMPPDEPELVPSPIVPSEVDASGGVFSPAPLDAQLAAPTAVTTATKPMKREMTVFVVLRDCMT
jgi:hypothetical protein